MSFRSVQSPILLYYSKDELEEDNNALSGLAGSRCPGINELMFLQRLLRLRSFGMRALPQTVFKSALFF